ncbi:YidB family protein [Streptomyces sp. NBC_00243]|uniref:YidB family protein n=1 Tax=Streptomyces sp. NBC_00243 TaxID=2975688 RepID=UPI002DD8D897|nr:YidB family protein [Streptomyces sp. NBC_00243]WRZ23611.1 YidB family protein [Streptomyces sp. NBC_00243]
MAGNDLGSLLGGLLGGGQGGASGGSGAGILGALLQSLAGGSGSGSGSGGNPLGGLLEMLTKSGLTEQKDSWVGTGENQSVTGAQIQQALPDETLKQVAEQAGVTPDQAATQIAETLPQAVDKLSPNGELPSASLEDLIKAQQV